MDKDTRPEARPLDRAAAKSFVRPAIAVSAFTIGLIYVLFLVGLTIPFETLVTPLYYEISGMG